MRFVISFISVAVLVLLTGLGVASAWRESASSGWGIDACLSCHVSPAEVPGYLRLLRSSKIRWLRERNVGTPDVEKPGRPGPGARFHPWLSCPALDSDQRRIWRAEVRAGFCVVAFATTLRNVPVEDDVDQLPEDLLAVYRAYQETARRTAGEVSAWEMVGEPETFYCRDLPDRVVAFQKAVYLGLKDGSREIRDVGPVKSRSREPTGLPANSRLPESSGALPGVLMGAFAFPPGPWVDAAAENGLFDYTDALNVHHYGFAKDFGDVIAAHREVAAHWTGGRSLPVWVTEVGLNNIPSNDWRNATARTEQADYLIDCAEQAMRAQVAVFMPFILVWRKSAFAMTELASDVHPAWTRYWEFTRRHPLVSSGPALAPPPAPNRMVLQWLPDTTTCTPNKTSRSYWFESKGDGGWSPIEGEIRAYNFGLVPLRVRLVEVGAVDARASIDRGAMPADPVDVIAPMSCRVYPVRIRIAGTAYFRATVRYRAETLDESGRVIAGSPLAFSLETMPKGELPHREIRLRLGPRPAGFNYIGGTAPYTETSDSVSCRGLNGVTVLDDDGAGGFLFDVKEENRDAVTPPQAILSLPAGMPPAKAGFLRLRAEDAWGRPAFVRVDLVDADGQRFSIVEGLGRNPFVDTGDTVLLGYRDFHRWVFGSCLIGVGFDPRRIREVQLRFCDAGYGKRFRVHLDVIDFAGK